MLPRCQRDARKLASPAPELLEALSRYAARPAVTESRLARLPSDRIRYAPKKRWRSGATALAGGSEAGRSFFLGRGMAQTGDERVRVASGVHDATLLRAAGWRRGMVEEAAARLPPPAATVLAVSVRVRDLLATACAPLGPTCGMRG